jgi:short-subunit dehydrogenase
MSYALITGASRGIGYELCQLFAKDRYHLVLVARRENSLNEISKKLESHYQVNTVTIPIDLSLVDAADKIFHQVMEKSITVDYLVNNAGFYVKGSFTGTAWEEEMSLISLQCLSHVRLTKLFLPGMVDRRKGGVLNVSSTDSMPDWLIIDHNIQSLPA